MSRMFETLQTRATEEGETFKIYEKIRLK